MGAQHSSDGDGREKQEEEEEEENRVALRMSNSIFRPTPTITLTSPTEQSTEQSVVSRKSARLMAGMVVQPIAVRFR